LADRDGEQATVVREVIPLALSAFELAWAGSVLAGLSFELVDGFAFTLSASEFTEFELPEVLELPAAELDWELFDEELFEEESLDGLGFFSGALDWEFGFAFGFSFALAAPIAGVTITAKAKVDARNLVKRIPLF
jgi:hypothetical protein